MMTGGHLPMISLRWASHDMGTSSSIYELPHLSPRPCLDSDPLLPSSFLFALIPSSLLKTCPNPPPSLLVCLPSTLSAALLLRSTSPNLWSEGRKWRAERCGRWRSRKIWMSEIIYSDMECTALIRITVQSSCLGYRITILSSLFPKTLQDSELPSIGFIPCNQILPFNSGSVSKLTFALWLVRTLAKHTPFYRETRLTSKESAAQNERQSNSHVSNPPKVDLLSTLNLSRAPLCVNLKNFMRLIFFYY